MLPASRLHKAVGLGREKTCVSVAPFYQFQNGEHFAVFHFRLGENLPQIRAAPTHNATGKPDASGLQFCNGRLDILDQYGNMMKPEIAMRIQERCADALTAPVRRLTTPDIHLHDTYYVIGHFHYVVAPGTIMALFGGIYYWYPKATGRHLNKLLGHLHFWTTLIFMNAVFMPMFFQGLAGLSRRLPNQELYVQGQAVVGWTRMSSMSAWCLGLAQIPFIINFFWSMWKKQRAEENPWQATTLEWATPTPPPHGNFLQLPVAHRGPYEYSLPGQTTDFCPQHVKPQTT